MDRYAATTINRRLAATSGLFAFAAMRDPVFKSPVPKAGKLGRGPRVSAAGARTYGLSQAWVSRLMAGYRVEGEATFEPRSRRPKAASPRALPVEVRDLIL